jgi:hypothetical protein
MLLEHGYTVLDPEGWRKRRRAHYVRPARSRHPPLADWLYAREDPASVVWSRAGAVILLQALLNDALSRGGCGMPFYDFAKWRSAG